MGDGSGKLYNCKDEKSGEEKRELGKYAGKGSGIWTLQNGRICVRNYDRCSFVDAGHPVLQSNAKVITDGDSSLEKVK